MRKYAFILLPAIALAQVGTMPTTTLWNGLKIPLLGFGTASLENDYEAMGWALDAGYRLIDTASLQHPAYHNADGKGNAEDLGRLLSERQLRDQVAVLSKNNIWAHGFNSTLADANRSLAALRTTYIDVFLIHHPSCFSAKCEGTWKDTYRAMERLYDEGTLKSIGVSNFNEPLLKELLQFARVRPHIVQNRHDPLTPDWAVIALCQREGIFYQSFSTLGRQYIAAELKRNPDFPNPVLTNEVVKDLAQKYNKTEAQVVLRWAVQANLGVLPKSTRAARIRSNAAIFDFELAEDEAALIDLLKNRVPAPQRANAAGATATFKNKGMDGVKVFWKDVKGDDLKLVLDLQPGEEGTLRSYIGHEFEVEGGRTVSTHKIRQPQEVFEIDHPEL